MVRNRNGQVLHDSLVSVLPEEAAITIDVRARKPIPLSDTGMVIARQRRNTGSYSYNNGSFTYSGRIQFVYAHELPLAKTDVSSTHGEVQALRRKALSNLSSGDIDIGVALGEIRTTAAMISKRLGNVSDAVKALRGGNAQGISDALSVPNTKALRRLAAAPPSKRLADGWLELHYGWGPVINDIYGAITQLRKTLLQGQTIGASTGEKDPRQGKAHELPKKVSELPNLARRARSHGTVSNWGLRTLAELGLVNPVNVAWQLLPYSFVVDWALPIGEILSGLTATAGLDNVWTSVVTEERKVNHIPAGWISISQEIKRTPFLEEFGRPVVDFRKVYTPSERVMADAVALLSQRFGRRP